MNENEINQKIDAEFKTWNDALFDLEPLPKYFIEMFKTAVFKLPAKAHQLSSMAIEKIMNKKLKELTNFEVPVIINAIQLLPMCDFSKDIEEGLKRNKEIENIKIGYNIFVQKFNHEMNTKRENMLKLSNPTKNSLKLAQA